MAAPIPLWKIQMNRNCYLILSGASLLLMPVAYAQIIADPSAPASQRPMVIETATGLPQVNIQAPSAGGVSRNTYSQFDVQQQGAVLNNSRLDVQTHTAGWIQGNANLAGGAARIILNEVNSANPSYLRGHLEVAGDRAQVIIANPSGVTCDGCGFINAGRTTLTTGTAIVNNGNLDGYRVTDGIIRIQGSGLDTRESAYTDIIGRAVEINAGIWGKDLKITSGANTIDASHTVVEALQTDTAVPRVGIDVAALGGMYANKIVLIGTGDGVGVRNAGEIGAAAGDVVVRADGSVMNRGDITASGSLSMTVAALENRGLLHGRETLIDGRAIANIGAGRIYGDHIAIAAKNFSNRAESAEAVDGVKSLVTAPIVAAFDRLDIAAAHLENTEHAALYSAGDIAIGGSLDLNHHATGIAALFENHSATIEAAHNLEIAADEIMNINDHFSTHLAEVSRQDIVEYAISGSPERYAADEIQIVHDEVDYLVTPTGGGYEFDRYNYTRVTQETVIDENDPSKMIAGGDMHISAKNILNDKSMIIAGGDLIGQFDHLENAETTGQRIISEHGIAAMLSKTKVEQIGLPGRPKNDGTRDKRTDLPLDDKGRYSEQAYVKGKLYQPKYFPCATAECQNHNLDMSDQGTKDYVKAMDLKILENIGDGANVAIFASPVGPLAIVAGITGSAAGVAGGVIEDNLDEVGESMALQYGFEQYLKKAYKISAPTAARAVAAIDLLGGWDAFVGRVNERLRE
jgi:filamentous hemagglutinin family protein